MMRLNPSCLALLLSLATACGGPPFSAGAGADAGLDTGVHDEKGCSGVQSCVSLRWECGTGTDACGQPIDCGSCARANTSCVNHACQCEPFTCAQFGAQCGQIPDGCGGTRSCGNCPAGQTCGAGGFLKCATGQCVPKSCADQGVACGQVDDGCGKLLQCPPCPPPETCGGGGMMNQCGCTPHSCTTLGWQCGTGDDGCGGALDCGACTSGQSCDPSSHSCTCSPKDSCSSLGYTCGAFVDSCGALEACGPAPIPLPTQDASCLDATHPHFYECAACASGSDGGDCSGPTPPEPTWDCQFAGSPGSWCCAQ